MNMLFIGDTSCRGTYYWHSVQHNGWVTADLDLGKAKLHDQLAIIRVLNDWTDVVDNVLVKRAGLGNAGDKWLVNGSDLMILFRDYPNDLEVLAFNEQSGKITHGATCMNLLTKICPTMAKWKKEHS